MMVDSHCHASPVWFEPVESILYQMEHNGISQAVIIQARGQCDNTYQQNCLRRFPGRFASVVAVDVRQPDVAKTLEALVKDGATGIRLRFAEASPGADKFALWRVAASLGIAASCVATSAQFASAEFEELAASLPQMPLVLEHLGGSAWPEDEEHSRAARMQLFEKLSRLPNVYLKIPGVGELLERRDPSAAEGEWLFEHAPPVTVFHEALRRFGASRLMWGSDYPPVGGREGYANALKWSRAQFQHLPKSDQDLIFGGVARQVFRLPSPK
jgi:L-fuconolactonase